MSKIVGVTLSPDTRRSRHELWQCVIYKSGQVVCVTRGPSRKWALNDARAYMSARRIPAINDRLLARFDALTLTASQEG